MIDESEKEREGGLDLKGLRKEGGRDHEGKWCGIMLDLNNLSKIELNIFMGYIAS